MDPNIQMLMDMENQQGITGGYENFGPEDNDSGKDLKTGIMARVRPSVRRIRTAMLNTAGGKVLGAKHKRVSQLKVRPSRSMITAEDAGGGTPAAKRKKRKGAVDPTQEDPAEK
ncbi:unnamed protein product [Heligmosomoides polygyrus]|uniref:Uncharacterized protein n=1 Tax=Heligmosomoides polygyrus TaxID=6339 RepID=A0A3P7TCV5_HELPZ|nr:unnamed protein product [Heligmosomoides polygyrus]